MARLTNAMRDGIVSKVLDYKFKERRAALAKRSQEVFDIVIDAVQGKHKTAIDSIPATYFKMTDSVYIVIDPKPGQCYSYYMNGAHPRPGGDLSRYSSLTEERVPAAALKIAREAAMAQWEYGQERDAVERKTRALVYSVPSTKRLYEVWPELAEIMPMPEEVDNTGTALTVNVGELNKMIGLPPEKKADAKTVRTKRKRVA